MSILGVLISASLELFNQDWRVSLTPQCLAGDAPLGTQRLPFFPTPVPATALIPVEGTANARAARRPRRCEGRARPRPEPPSGSSLERARPTTSPARAGGALRMLRPGLPRPGRRRPGRLGAFSSRRLGVPRGRPPRCPRAAGALEASRGAGLLSPPPLGPVVPPLRGWAAEFGAERSGVSIPPSQCRRPPAPSAPRAVLTPLAPGTGGRPETARPRVDGRWRCTPREACRPRAGSIPEPGPGPGRGGEREGPGTPALPPGQSP